MNRDKSKQLFEKAKELFPGGVNSPVRAFKSVGGVPLFFDRGKGAKFWDVDGNEFLDFCCSWGPLILGHANAKIKENILVALEKGTSFGAPSLYENELGHLIISNHQFIEKIRFVSSGTEATMSAIRLARGYTKKNKIIKFDGCYHGHSDSLLVKAGSGLVTFGTSSSAGVPEVFAKETIVLPLNDKAALASAFEKYKGEIAGVIIEPIPANNGLLLQAGEYLGYLREICTEEKALLIFDEVISGFRIGFEGAAGYYGIKPDIFTFGKIIGGGLPVGAYASSNEIMKEISPEGPVYQAGTLSGNPIAMAAGIAQLSACLAPGFYENLAIKTKNFASIIAAFCEEKSFPVKVFSIGSIFWLSFSKKENIRAADDINPNGISQFTQFYNEILNNGIYFGPSGYEVGFVSNAHTVEDLDKAAQIINQALDKVFKK